MQDIFIEMSQTISLIGQDSTINLLRKAREQICNPTHIKKIFEIVCEVFGLAINSVEQLKYRTDERILVISFCTFYAKKKMDCSNEEINQSLNLTFSRFSFSRYFNVIKNANYKNPKSSIDIEICKYNKQINEKVNNYFKTIK